MVRPWLPADINVAFTTYQRPVFRETGQRRSSPPHPFLCFVFFFFPTGSTFNKETFIIIKKRKVATLCT